MAKEKKQIIENTAEEGDLKAKLRRIRDEAGYTIPQMADAMCLSESVITDLENEDFDKLADPPYIRGYLRNYAKLSDNDPTELIECYESLRGSDGSDLDYKIKASSSVNTQSKKSISPVIAQLLLLALLLAGLGSLSMIPGVNNWIKSSWENFSNQFSSGPNQGIENPDLIGSLPVPIPLPEDTPSSVEPLINSNSKIDTNSDQAQPQPTESTNVESVNNTDSDQEIVTTNTETPETVNVTPEPTEVATITTESEEPTLENLNTATDTISVKLIFNKEVWLRIKDKDNKTVFEGLNPVGTDKNLNLQKPLTFKVGNAQGLSLMVDDEAIDISQYIKGSVANFTLE